MRIVSVLILLLGFLRLSHAQVKTNFNNVEPISSMGKFQKNFREKNPYVIPARDIKSLLENEESKNTPGEAKPFRIAEAIDVDIDVMKEATWTEDDEFVFGKFSIVAAGAKSISINFDKFRLPERTELYVYSENGEMITGPLTEKENNVNNFWGSWVYKGEKLTVDFKTPLSTKSTMKLHISSVAYGYKNIYKDEVSDFGESSSCNINVMCDLGNGWENERNSVALILNGNSTAICSGVLVNNTCNTNLPYFLTANHCFDGSVSNWKFTFQAWSAACTPSQNANGITFNGSTLRARSNDSDFCLVELNQVPSSTTGITYAGWSRQTTGVTNATIIHHPAGDVMKISRDDQAPILSTHGVAQVWMLTIDQGATDPGSSGGAYFDQNHRVIGQHKGINQNNSDECLNTNKFGGRFDISWTGGSTNATRLSNWLDPANTGAMTTDARGIGISGPDVVCTVGQYSFAGLGVTWSSNNPNGLSISVTGFATRQNNFNGQVTIAATINGGCGGTTTSFTRNIWVGEPSPVTQFSVYQQICGSGVQWWLDPTPWTPYTTYNWTFADAGNPTPFGTTQSATAPMYIYLYGNASSSWDMTVTPQNACGVGATYSTTWGNPCDGGGDETYSIYPNPSNGEITIASGVLEIQSYDKRYFVTIVNEQNKVMYQDELLVGGRIKVQVQNWEAGTYYAKLVGGVSAKQIRLIVEH